MRKKLVIVILFLILLLFIYNNDKKISIKNRNKEYEYTIGKDKLPFSDEEIYNQLFDLNNIISVSIDIPEIEIKKMQSDFEENENTPIYRMANLKISIETPNQKKYSYYIDEIGIRLKGNKSKGNIYNEQKGIQNLNHFKIKINETFDDVKDGYLENEYYIDESGKSTLSEEGKNIRKNRTFANMEKIDLKWNRNFDTTFIREIYAFKLFRENKIAAPNIGLATMNINIKENEKNSEYLGVYTIHEVIDKKFIDNNLLNDNNEYLINKNADYKDKDLYKAKWSNINGFWIGANLTKDSSYGIEDDFNQKRYNYNLKTNKKKSDFSSIKNLIDGINNVNSKEDIEKYVDINYFIKFAAVSYVTGNVDDIKNNYNNYYLYFYNDNDVEKMIIIPYDYDISFGINLNNQISLNDYKDPVSNYTYYYLKQENPLYNYTIGEDGYYLEEYKKALKEVINSGLLNIKKFKKDYDIAKKNYGDKTTLYKNFDNILTIRSTPNLEKDSFYFTLDETNDIKKLNTTNVKDTNMNLNVENYFDFINKKVNKILK